MFGEGIVSVTGFYGAVCKPVNTTGVNHFTYRVKAIPFNACNTPLLLANSCGHFCKSGQSPLFVLTSPIVDALFVRSHPRLDSIQIHDCGHDRALYGSIVSVSDASFNQVLHTLPNEGLTEARLNASPMQRDCGDVPHRNNALRNRKNSSEYDL